MLSKMLFSVGIAVFFGILLYLPALLMKRHPPKDMNAIYGYRTRRSMKNMELWREGNRYSTELMLKQSYVVTIAGVVIGIGVGAWFPVVAIFSTMGIMVLLFIIMTVKVESHLKKMEQAQKTRKKSIK